MVFNGGFIPNTIDSKHAQIVPTTNFGGAAQSASVESSSLLPSTENKISSTAISVLKSSLVAKLPAIETFFKKQPHVLYQATHEVLSVEGLDKPLPIPVIDVIVPEREDGMNIAKLIAEISGTTSNGKVAGWLSDTLKQASADKNILRDFKLPDDVLVNIQRQMIDAAGLLDTLQLFRTHLTALHRASKIVSFNSDTTEQLLNASVQNWSLHALSQIRRGKTIIIPVDLPNAGNHLPGGGRVTHATSCLIRPELDQNNRYRYILSHFLPEGREGKSYRAHAVDRERTDDVGKIRRGTRLSHDNFTKEDEGQEVLTPNRFVNRKTKSLSAEEFIVTCPTFTEKTPSINSVLSDADSMSRILACGIFVAPDSPAKEMLEIIVSGIDSIRSGDGSHKQRAHGIQSKFTCEYKSSVGPLAEYFDSELTFQVARYCFRRRAQIFVNENSPEGEEKSLKKILEDKTQRAAAKLKEEIF